MTPTQLDEIAAREKAATKGPWRWDEFQNMRPPAEMADWDEDLDISEAIIQTDGGHYGPKPEDRAFIAHARTDIPALLAHIAHLERRVGEVDKLISAADLMFAGGFIEAGVTQSEWGFELHRRLEILRAALLAAKGK